MDSTAATQLLMSVLKLSCNEIISEAKIKILRAIDISGDVIESLDQLENYLDVEKELLSLIRKKKFKRSN